jgi:tetratricopeptide (TPR) repeat protein
MIWKTTSLIIRIVVAVVLGGYLIRWAGFSPLLPIVAVPYGLLLWVLFGIPFIRRVGDAAASIYTGDDTRILIMPEYGVAEARVGEGKYEEAIDEYRKVILEYPDDIYPHLRIAELAVKHLNDVKLAELELLSAMGKAKGEDTTALAAGRLADFYQHTLQDPARALEVMKQLRERIPGTKQARLAEERIVLLESIAHGGVVLPKTPDKIAHRPSRYNMWE